MDDARAFAITAHGGQLYGGKPYETHLAAVVQVLCDFGYDESYRQAGWLHDVVEDTPVPLSVIRNRFGETVAELVDAVTGLGPTRQARNARIHAGTGRSANRASRIICGLHAALTLLAKVTL